MLHIISLNIFTGDQILDVDGTDVGKMTIEEVSKVLKAAPILITCTVKPANHFRYCENQNENKNSSYAEIDIGSLAATNKALSIVADYEEDHSSTCSEDYVIPFPSDDELEDNDSKHYVNTSPQPPLDDADYDQNDYVNLPEMQTEPRKKKAEVPPGQRNYLELYFEKS